MILLMVKLTCMFLPMEYVAFLPKGYFLKQVHHDIVVETIKNLKNGTIQCHFRDDTFQYVEPHLMSLSVVLYQMCWYADFMFTLVMTLMW